MSVFTNRMSDAARDANAYSTAILGLLGDREPLAVLSKTEAALRKAITGYDQDAWADRLGYDKTNVTEALDEFSVLRKANLRLLKRAAPADLERVGVHSERGEESVRHWIKLYAGHDTLHLNQIKRIRGAIGA
jgi:hypothetical protein